MLRPSSPQLEDDRTQAKDAPLATGLQDLLEAEDHGNDLDYSCYGENSFLSPAVVGHLPSDIVLDMGSPSRELLPREDLVAPWGCSSRDVLPAEDLAAGLGSPSMAAGISIDTLGFGHDFGYDSFTCTEEPVLGIGSSGDFGGAAASSGSMDTDWQLSLPFEGAVVPVEQSISGADSSWEDGSELDPNSMGLCGEGKFKVLQTLLYGQTFLF